VDNENEQQKSIDQLLKMIDEENDFSEDEIEQINKDLKSVGD